MQVFFSSLHIEKPTAKDCASDCARVQRWRSLWWQMKTVSRIHLRTGTAWLDTDPRGSSRVALRIESYMRETWTSSVGRGVKDTREAPFQCRGHAAGRRFREFWYFEHTLVPCFHWHFTPESSVRGWPKWLNLCFHFCLSLINHEDKCELDLYMYCLPAQNLLPWF